MENKYSKGFAIKIGALSLMVLAALLLGFWQGRAQQIDIYQSKIAVLPDINPCHP